MKESNKKLQISFLELLYDMIKNERDCVDEDVRIMTGQEGYKREGPPHKNQMSLRISTESNLKFLQGISKESYDLFFFIGCLKDGIEKDILNDLCG